MSKAWDINVYEAPPKPAGPRWNHNHATRETITRVGVLSGLERTELLRAWDKHGQLVYAARSNAAREAEALMSGNGRARPTVNKGAGHAASRQAA